ncbi:hypothetical protein Lser_V15G41788 [Lactuca serriola]
MDGEDCCYLQQHRYIRHVRELSIMTAKCHPAAVRFIPDQPESDGSIKDASSSEKEPIR